MGEIIFRLENPRVFCESEPECYMYRNLFRLLGILVKPCVPLIVVCLYLLDNKHAVSRRRRVMSTLRDVSSTCYLVYIQISKDYYLVIAMDSCYRRLTFTNVFIAFCFLCVIILAACYVWGNRIFRVTCIIHYKVLMTFVYVSFCQSSVLCAYIKMLWLKCALFRCC